MAATDTDVAMNTTAPNMVTMVTNSHQELFQADKIWTTTTGLITIIANGILISVEVKDLLIRKEIILPRMLVLFLASSDVACMVLAVSMTMVMWFAGTTTIGCLIGHFAVSTFATFSKTVLILMAVERHIALNKPFFYITHCGTRQFLYVLLILFIYSIAYGIFIVVAISAVDSYEGACYHGKTGDVFHQWIAEMWSFIQELVFICTLSFANISVMFTLKKMERSVGVFCPRDRLEYLRQLDMVRGTGREFFRLMLAINIVFIVLTIPHVVSMKVRK